MFSSIGTQGIQEHFSRRIGAAKDIDGNTIENRIIAGLRLSGKITDNLRLGLNMQTEQDESNKISSNNNMVLSLQQRVFQNQI